MKKITLGAALMLLAACALLAAAATAGTAVVQNTNSGKSENTANANTKANANKSNANRGSSAAMTPDEKFAMEAAMGGLAEVEFGRVAAQKGATDEVRQFGQRMVDDHSKANQDLMQVASNKGWTLPAALDAKHQAELQKLSALSGDKLDKTYVDMMIKDHKQDTAAFQKESTGGADADVKAFAARTLPVVQEHLQMIQRIHDKMALRKSGNLKTMNSNSGGDTSNTNSNSGNSNSKKSKGNKNSNSNAGSNSNSNM